MADFMSSTDSLSKEAVRRPPYGPIADSGFQAPQSKQQSMNRLSQMGQALQSRAPGLSSLSAARSRFGMDSGQPDQDRELSDRTEILRRNPLAIGSSNPFARMVRGGRQAAGTASGSESELPEDSGGRRYPPIGPDGTDRRRMDEEEARQGFGGRGRGYAFGRMRRMGRGQGQGEPLPTPQPNPLPNPAERFGPASIYSPPDTRFFRGTPGGPGGPGGGPPSAQAPMDPRLADRMNRVPMLPRRGEVYNPYGRGGAFEDRSQSQPPYAPIY